MAVLSGPAGKKAYAIRVSGELGTDQDLDEHTARQPGIPRRFVTLINTYEPKAAASNGTI